MLMFDRYPLDDAAKVSITRDGYLVATPRVARTGIQLYYGRELGVTGRDASKVFKVYRPESEVFHKDSMASYAYKPMTDDHPPENVTVDNWKKYSRGQMSGDVARDGDFIRVPMALMDGTLVQKYKDGKAELSMGYECEIVWQPGTTPQGEVYDASQKDIRSNHCAVVDAARGGQDLRIGDGSGARVDLGVYAQALEAIAAGNVNKESALADGSGHLAKDSKGIGIYAILKDGTVYVSSLRANKTDAVTKGDGDALAALDNLLARAEGTSTSAVADRQQETWTMAKTIVIDGVPCTVDNDQTAAVIQRALDSSAAALKAAQDAFGKEKEENEKNKKKVETDAVTHTTVVSQKDAEIVTLKKAVEDSKLTPAKLDQLVKDRALIAGKARAILGDKLVVDNKTDTEIMKQVVDAKLGDAAKGWNDDNIKISFDTLTAGTKAVDVAVSGVNDTARAFSSPAFGTGDARQQADAVIAARDTQLQNAWKGGEQKVN
jgi:hypothetical protein